MSGITALRVQALHLADYLRVPALPKDRLVEVMKEYGRLVITEIIDAAGDGADCVGQVIGDRRLVIEADLDSMLADVAHRVN